MPIARDVYRKIVGAKVFIDENFREQIDLDAIAGEACLPGFHFHRLVRRILAAGRVPGCFEASARGGGGAAAAGDPILFYRRIHGR